MRALSRGYTLIELSIVLVILGLLAGGVLTGRVLLRQSELRSIITDFNTYETAVGAFREKFGCIPGDCITAPKYLGQASNCWGGYGVPLVGGTCNTVGSGAGREFSGDGIIAWTSGSAYPPNEASLFWQQLALADLIPGKYAGVPGADVNGNPMYTQAGFNAPNSRVSGACFAMKAPDTYGNYQSLWPSALPQGNYYQFGSSADNTCYSNVLKPSEARSLDTKIDDGMPEAGKVAATLNYCCTGLNSACYDYGTATYQSSDGGTNGCGLLFYSNAAN